MQALILTAGAGTRLKPLTDTLPKCLIPVAGRPILDYQLEALRAANAGRIDVVTGAHAEKVREHISSQGQVNAVYNPDYKTTNILYSFWIGLKQVTEDSLLVLAGDVVFEKEIISRLIAHGGHALRVCVNRKECGEEEVKVIVQKGRVERFGKALDPKTAYGEFLGVFYLEKEALKNVKAITSEMISGGKKGSYLFDMLNALIERDPGCAGAFEVRDLLWEEIDYPEDVDRATRKLLSHQKAARR